ncbi:MAG: DUF1559 domain-containing protein [Pirellulaceae bacterium]|nr:DUF1559 domain-containing protein [Pirellulaceae bacterium]
MPIQFSCPHCGRQTLVADEYAGQSGPCLSCGQTITIPGVDAANLDKPRPRPAPRPVGSGSSVGLVLAIIGICLIVVIACGGGLIFLRPGGVFQNGHRPSTRTQCSNNLKQIALAFHNYHAVYGSFPPAYLPDENGQPKHSWRVLLLPFLEQQALYDAYDFDEPWDSPVNAMVTETVLPIFQCPAEPPWGTPVTNYMVITGPGTVFEDERAPALRDILDGTSNTLLIVEVAGSGTQWAEPVDLDASQLAVPFGAVANSPGSQHPGGVQAAMCDGSVQFLPYNISPTTFNALVTRAGGEAIPPY